MVVFWSNDVSILYNQNNLLDFFPDSSQDSNAKLNSLVRLSFYISVALALYKKDYSYLYIFITTLIVTFIIYRNSTELLENVEQASLSGASTTTGTTVPTIDNPFMNFTMGDYMNIAPDGKHILTKPQYANPLNPIVKDEMSTNYNIGSMNPYQDANDLFERNTGEWSFFTVAGSGDEPASSRAEFQDWCYKSPTPNCKEDSKCYYLQNRDLRQAKFIYPDGYNDPSKISK